MLEVVLLFLLILVSTVNAYTWNPYFNEIYYESDWGEVLVTGYYSEHCVYNKMDIYPLEGNYGVRDYRSANRVDISDNQCDSLTIYAYYPGDTTKHKLIKNDPGSCTILYEEQCGDQVAGVGTVWGAEEALGLHPAVPYMGVGDTETLWTSLETICDDSGLEGEYNFEVYSEEDQKYGIEPYCTFIPSTNPQPLMVEWNDDEDWCERSACGKGDWSATQGCCSPREMANWYGPWPSGSVTAVSQYYTNEDCSPPRVPGVRELCYYSQNPKWEGVSSDAEWFSTSDMLGEIVYEGCGDVESTSKEDGHEFLAGNSGWVDCDTSDWQVNVSADDGTGRTVQHEYICVTSVSPQEYSLAECNHDSSTGSDLYDLYNKPGGIYARGGHSVNTSGGEVYFCNNNSDWSVDLDSYDKSGEKGEYCKNAKFPPTSYNGDSLSGTNLEYTGVGSEWTGSYCCGETDDWELDYPDTSFTVGNEYYNDDDRSASIDKTTKPGGCFNNWYQANESFLTIYDIDDQNSKELYEVMVWHGTFQGCAINDSQALINKESTTWSNEGFVREDIDCSSARTNDTNKPYEGTVGEISNFETNYGFSASAIQSAGGSCEDPDGGIVYNVGSTVTCGASSFVDTCVGPNFYEFYCVGNTLKRQTLSCPYGCSASGCYYGYYSVVGDVVVQSCSSGGSGGGSGSNDFLLLLDDKPNPGSGGTNNGQLILDNEYCNIKNWSNGESYFCSYNETWIMQQQGQERSHLSFIPWKNASLQQAECCDVDQCWNGTECIDSVTETLDLSSPHKIMNERGDGFMCKDGDWDWSFQKTNWDGSEEGYCLENTQCYVGDAGQYGLTNTYGPLHYDMDDIFTTVTPACINNTEFYMDYYCENGTWTSRTKFVALELYNLVKSNNDYTLYCDSYDKVLNKFDYAESLYESATVEEKYFLLNPSSKCVIYDGVSVPCVNHVCVLIKSPQSNNPTIYLGASLNYKINTTTSLGDVISVYDFGEAFGENLIGCEDEEGVKDEFKKCGSSNDIYYNGKKNIIIFSRSSFTGGIDYVTMLKKLFSNFLNTLLDWLLADTTTNYNLLERLADELYYTTSSYIIPNFECTDNGGCHGNPATSRVFSNEICGERGNPRKTLDLNTLLLSRKGGETIFGFAEYEADSTLISTRWNGLMFEGFSDNVCDAFTSNDVGYKCEKHGTRYIIYVKPTNPAITESYNSIVDIGSWEQWVYIGPSTRIHN